MSEFEVNLKTGQSNMESTGFGNNSTLKAVEESYAIRGSVFNQVFDAIDNGNIVITESNEDTFQELMKEYENFQNESNSYYLAKDIYRDINAKTTSGLPTTGKDIEKHIDEINKDNVLNVMSSYNLFTNNKGGMLTSILDENNLPSDVRTEYVEHILAHTLDHYEENGVYVNDVEECLIEELDKPIMHCSSVDGEQLDNLLERLEKRLAANNADRDNIRANGKIDADFKQHMVGDCWLLAGIKAIASNPETLELLNNCITSNRDGSVTVMLKGVNEEYTISKKELNGRNELASGDLDVRAIEIAVNKYMEKNYFNSPNSNEKINLDSNTAYKAFEILLGTSTHQTDIFGDLEILNNKHKDPGKHVVEKIKSGKNIAIVSHNLTSPNKVKAKRQDGTQETILSNHAYSAVGADNKYVYVVNPHDSSQKLTLTHDQFIKAFNAATIVNVEEALRA